MSSAPLPVAIHGAAGRMGQALLSALAGVDGWRCVAAIVRAGAPCLGQPVPGHGGLVYVDATTAHRHDVPEGGVVIDFSGPDGLLRAIELAEVWNWALFSGSTGLGPAEQQALDALAVRLPVAWTANTSLGIALLSVLVRRTAAVLDADWDIEILDLHHRHKRDAPSGTALKLAEAAAAGRGGALSELRADPAEMPRRRGAIGIVSQRAGDVVGEHRVLFAASGERLEFVHQASERGVFARGALAMASALARRPPGRYGPETLLPASGLS